MIDLLNIIIDEYRRDYPLLEFFTRKEDGTGEFVEGFTVITVQTKPMHTIYYYALDMELLSHAHDPEGYIRNVLDMMVEKVRKKNGCVI